MRGTNRTWDAAHGVPILVRRAVPRVLLSLGILLGSVASVLAQSAPTREIAQGQADAVSQMIVLGVEQNLGLLPPNGGQAYTYRYDPAVGTFTRDDFLGPFWFNTPATLGKDRIDLRVAFSYFDLDGEFGPVDYTFSELQSGRANPVSLERVSLETEARVFTTNLSLSYGIFETVDLYVNLPIVVVDASSDQSFITDPDQEGYERNYYGADPVPGLDDGAAIDQALASQERIAWTNSLTNLGASFNEGTQAGIGRVTFGSKADFRPLLPASWAGWFELGGGLSLAIPSPDEDQFSGSDSFALFPRLYAASGGQEARARAFLDVGYQQDFSFDELSRFAWTVGTSIFASSYAVFDLGVSGSVYASEIDWTPQAGNVDVPGQDSEGRPIVTNLSYSADADTGIGKNLVDLLIGARVAVVEDLTLSGGVSVPINDEGFRPAAAGTLAVEYTFGGPR
jgi:hypothetical protein